MNIFARLFIFFVISFLYGNEVHNNHLESKIDSKVNKITQFYDLELLKENEKIKQLNYEINALEAQAKAESKWDNPRFSVGYNNAEVMMPFTLNANEMQNIFISLEQNFDLNSKRKFLSKNTLKEVQIKLLELKNIKNQYIFSLISESININKNKQILNSTNNAIHNINIVLESLKSSNYNPLQLQKLNILKAKVQMKQNEIQNLLKTSHISISETSFESIDNIEVRDIDINKILSLDYDKILQEILSSNYEIKAQNLRENLSSDSIKLAKMQYLPDLNIGFSYMFRVNRTDMFGLNVSFPLPIYSKENNEIKKVQMQNMIEKSKALDTQNRIKHNVFGLLNNLNTLKENLSLIDKILLPSNEQIINLYKHHTTSNTDLFQEFYNALNDKVETEILRLEILAQMNIIYWNLESLKGEK